MERLTLTKEQRIIEEVGYVTYLKPEILTEWDKKLSAYEDTGLESEEIICKQETEKRMSDYISFLHEEDGCLLTDNMSEKYGDCRKGCYKCICDALKEQAAT